MKRILLVLALASSALAQTTVNGRVVYAGAVNAKTSTYQTLISDFNSPCPTIPVASGTFTITLVASGSQPPAGECLTVINYGSGVVTIARSGQNINGGTASLTLAAGSASAPTGITVTSDGTNYVAQPVAATGVGSVNGFTGAVCYIGALAVTPIVPGDWSVIGSGGSQSTVTGPCGSAITVTGTTGGSGNVYGVKVAVVNGNFTHTLILYGAINQQNFSSIAAGFTDGTKVESCGATWLANSGELTILNTLTSALSGGTYNAANGNTLTHNANGSVWPLIIKLTRSGTALSCGVSYDQGITYYTSFTDTVPQQTPTHILVYADPRGASDAGHLTLVSYN